MDLEQICENYKFKWTEAKRSIVEKEEQILEAQAQVRVKEKEMNELSKVKYSIITTNTCRSVVCNLPYVSWDRGTMITTKT